jgi:hypothetical protein
MSEGMTLSSPAEKHFISVAYEQPQAPPQQRLLQEGSYQQQSYRPERVGPIFFVFAFLSFFFMMNTSCLSLTIRLKNSRLKRKG